VEYQSQASPKPKVATGHKEEPVPALPRIGQPLKDGDIFTASPRPSSKAGSFAQSVGKLIKDNGQTPPQSPPAVLDLIKAADKALGSKTNDGKPAEGFSALLREWTTLFLQSPVGWPFRQAYNRKIAAVVLGSPYGDVGIIVDAIDSLTILAVCSLKEDKYGNVQKDVRKIIQTLTATTTGLELFKNGIGTHWTDVLTKSESPEVDLVLTALKDALNYLIEAFGDYSEDLRLSRSELRLAREAARKPDAISEPKKVEMQENR
jgi:nucleoporin NDC1